jgi:hypothetical protein
VNWRYLKDRYGDDWRRMKGEFGELIVREFLQQKGFELERMERRARKLPDFKIVGKPVMVEVKSHKSRTPGIWQKSRFQSMVKTGWQIMIARPRVYLSWDEAHIICSGIDWFIFNGEGRLERHEDFPGIPD